MSAILVLPRAASKPIGAADLKASATRLLKRALVISCAIHVTVVGSYLAARSYLPRQDAAYRGRSIRVVTLPPPEVIPLKTSPPSAPTLPGVVDPEFGTPVMVPTLPVICGREPFGIPKETGARPPGEGGKEAAFGVVEDARDPLPEDFVYREEEPEAVTKVEPEYPEIARDA